MQRCLTSARYTMKADVHRQTVVRNATTGQQERSWAYSHTIDCQARGVVSGGIRVVGSTERFSPRGDYEDVDWVKMQTGEHLSKRDRITNIRNADGVIWKDGVTDLPINFDVLGVTPLPSPFGSVSDYDVILERVQD